VHWFVNDRELCNTDRIFIDFENGVCTMQITHVTSQDEAVYVLEASNKVGKATVSANLVILCK